jgi:hypothetical protein
VDSDTPPAQRNGGGGLEHGETMVMETGRQEEDQLQVHRHGSEMAMDCEQRCASSSSHGGDSLGVWRSHGFSAVST